VIPIVTPAEMAAIDAAAPVPVAALVERAGAAVARAAVDLLGGTYGRRVAVIAGKGNNGADGRAAATRLQRRGVRCVVLEPDIAALPVEVDLVIDAATARASVGPSTSRPSPRVSPSLPSTSRPGSTVSPERASVRRPLPIARSLLRR